MRCTLEGALAVTSLLLGGALAWTLHQASHAPYQCEMTYMWPRYEPVDIGGDHGSRYRLLLYSDDSIPAHAKGAPLAVAAYDCTQIVLAAFVAWNNGDLTQEFLSNQYRINLGRPARTRSSCSSQARR